jgi:hypothetical protein
MLQREQQMALGLGKITLEVQLKKLKEEMPKQMVVTFCVRRVV